jgi:hypothetical protein
MQTRVAVPTRPSMIVKPAPIRLILYRNDHLALRHPRGSSLLCSSSSTSPSAPGGDAGDPKKQAESRCDHFWAQMQGVGPRGKGVTLCCGEATPRRPVLAKQPI